MKPNFALSLSQDSIRLLHRSAGGWNAIGEANIGDGDLGERLEAMRQSAERLEPANLHCKVVIPDDQIKYLSVPLDLDSIDDTDLLARQALTGATPYSVDELAFDTCTIGDSLQVAAVARETLAEAEEFATQNQFNPVCFVADPKREDFEGEPFFGALEAGELTFEQNSQIERDAAPVSRRAAAQESEKHIENASEETAEASFVSRRTVPTFRTEPQTEEFLPDLAEASGFAEPASTYHSSTTSAPVSTAKRGRSHSSVETHRMMDIGAGENDALAGRRESLMRVIAVVVIVSLGIAGFASGVFSKGWTALFDRPAPEAPELRFAAPIQPDSPQLSEPQVATIPTNDQPARESELSDVDAAVLDALATPEPDLPSKETMATAAPPVPKPGVDDLLAYYAVYGIWPKAPNVPNPSALVDINDFYTPTVDTKTPSFDFAALPAPTSYENDEAMLSPASPAPAGTRFTLDENGLVTPTTEGTLNPDGITVFAGPPPVRQPENLVRIETPDDDQERRLRLSAVRPVMRPDRPVPEQNEPPEIDVGERAELASIRPRLRPQIEQENPLANASLVSLDTDGALVRDPAEVSIIAPNARAVRASPRPATRPGNFGEIVARAQRTVGPEQTIATTARVAPRAVTPSIPSSASTAREATERNAINLRKVNLIGVYGTPSSRRALVRLGNGRYQKVSVGDRIDGGRVSAISDSELRYQKSGRAVVLKMPSS